MTKERKTKLEPYAAELSQWFGSERLTLAAAQGRLREKYGVSVSLNGLSSWWQREQQRQLREQILGRIVSGAQLTAEVEREFTRNAPPETETLMKLLRVLVMQLSVQGAANPEMLKLVTCLLHPVMEHVKNQQKERELALSEAKFQRETAELFLRWAEDQRAREIAASGESNAEKIERLKQLMFGDVLGKGER